MSARRTRARASSPQSRPRSRHNLSELETLVQALENDSAKNSAQSQVPRYRRTYSGPLSKKASKRPGSELGEDPLDVDWNRILPDIGVTDEEETSVGEPARKKARQSRAPKRKPASNKASASKPRVRFDSQPNTQSSQDDGANSEMEDMDNTAFLQQLKTLTEKKKRAHKARDVRTEKRAIASMVKIGDETKGELNRIVTEITNQLTGQCNQIMKAVNVARTTSKKQSQTSTRAIREAKESVKELVEKSSEFKQHLSTLRKRFEASQVARRKKNEEEVKSKVRRRGEEAASRAEIDRRLEAFLEMTMNLQ